MNIHIKFKKVLFVILIYCLFLQNAYCGIPIGFVTVGGNTEEEAIKDCYRKAIGNGLQEIYKIKNGSELYKHIIQQDNLKQFIESPVSYPTASKTIKGGYLATENIDLDKGAIDSFIRKFIEQLFFSKFGKKPDIAISFVVTSSQVDSSYKNIFHKLAEDQRSSEKNTIFNEIEMEKKNLSDEKDVAEDRVLSAMGEQAIKVNTVIKKLLRQYDIYPNKIVQIDNWLQQKNAEVINDHSSNVVNLTNEFIKMARDLLKSEGFTNKIDFLIIGVVNIRDSIIKNDFVELTAEVNGTIIIEIDGKQYDLSIHVEKITKQSNSVGSALNDVYYYAARDIFYNNILSELSQKHGKYKYKLVFQNIEDNFQIQTDIITMIKQLESTYNINTSGGSIEVVIESSISNVLEFKLFVYQKMNKEMKNFFQNIKTVDSDTIIFKINYSNKIHDDNNQAIKNYPNQIQKRRGSCLFF